ncbi:hypothetical protein [Nocardia amamiensis]|uniref:hypothetical protein n=1 Tax=Nocardia amamiensis TaxID=404578 RepID=UPI00082CFE73|nr:hypothetical protein [Nocardia amamiensis]
MTTAPVFDPDIYDPYAAVRGLPPDHEGYYRTRIALLAPHPRTWTAQELVAVIVERTATLTTRTVSVIDALDGFDDRKQVGIRASDLSAQAGVLDAALRTAHHAGTSLDTATFVSRLDPLPAALQTRLIRDSRLITVALLNLRHTVWSTADLGRIRGAAAALSAAAAHLAAEHRGARR